LRHPFLNFLKKFAVAVGGHGLGQIKPVRAVYDQLFHFLKPKSVMVQGHRMWLDDLDTLELATHEVYEPFETALFRNEIKPGQTVLDIGANIGYYTLIAAKLVGPKGKVYAFEPDPNNFDLLKKNVETNGYTNVVLINKAVSDKNRTSKLFLSKTNKGDHRLYDSKDRRPFVTVQTIKLDDFFKHLDKKIHFIKMDIQGSEAGAVKGLKFLIKKNPHIKLITEFWPYGIKRAGDSAPSYLIALKKLGFKIFEISEKEKTKRPARLKNILKRCTIQSQNYANLFCEKG
jgi:FkbM family methyltransferase